MSNITRGASDFLKIYKDIVKKRTQAPAATPDFSYSEASNESTINAAKQTEDEKRKEEFKKILNGGR